MMRKLVLLAAMGLGACASVPKADARADEEAVVPTGVEVEQVEGGKLPLLPLPELVRRMEASPVEYVIDDLSQLGDVTPEQLVERVWPSRDSALDCVRTGRDAQGKATLTRCPSHPEIAELLARAEAHYQERRFKEAEALYLEALRIAPTDYLTTLYAGDAALFGGDPKTALERYERATALNPDDHRSYFFRATALDALGRPDEAHAMYAWALALRPGAEHVLTATRTKGARLGLELLPPVLQPRAYARKEGEKVRLSVDQERPAWLAFGLCKALWMGEEGLRKERTGSAKHQWTSLEETECLAALATAYEGVEKKEGKPDPALERLLRIIGAHQHLELILYDVASRQQPHIVLLGDEALRRRMHAYVLQHVLVKSDGKAREPRPGAPARPDADRGVQVTASTGPARR